MNNNIIEAKNIFKSFYGNQVLKNVNLNLQSGEALCIAGSNGSGKSTLIKIISGAYSFDAGNLKINDKVFESITPNQSMAEGIQVIYQDFSVFPNLTVAENIGLSHHLLEGKKKFDLKESREIARQSLHKIGIEMDPDAIVGDLPVSKKQIVAIARAITLDAKVIIMDEPTTALTQNEIEKLYEIINALKANGVGIIFVSHKFDEIFKVCDRIMVIRNGLEVANAHVSKFEKSKLAYYMTGEELELESFTYNSKGEECIFKVSRLCCESSFSEVSFHVEKGEILCITGRLGSGRAELAKTLFGVKPATGGTILLNGKEIQVRSVQEALKNGIAYIPDDRLSEGLFLGATIKDNVVSAVTGRLTNRIGLKNKKKITETGKLWKDKFQIKCALDDPASSLSGGNQQRVVLAKWIASNPKLLILNCPTVGVDVKSKKDIHQVVRELSAEGIGVVMISDDIDEILYNSNRVLVMNNGRITHECKTSEMTYDELSEMLTESVS